VPSLKKKELKQNPSEYYDTHNNSVKKLSFIAKLSNRNFRRNRKVSLTNKRESNARNDSEQLRFENNKFYSNSNKRHPLIKAANLPGISVISLWGKSTGKSVLNSMFRSSLGESKNSEGL
jgi:hypothetical protein